MASRQRYSGVFLSETASERPSVTPATTNLTAFIGEFREGPIDQAVLVSSQSDFDAQFGTLDRTSSLAVHGVRLFFLNGGSGAWIVRLAPDGTDFLTAVRAELQPGARLDRIAPDTFNLMCVPDLVAFDVEEQTPVWAEAHAFCRERCAFLLVDPPSPGVDTSPGKANLLAWARDLLTPDHVGAAAYYPWLRVTDPATGKPAGLPPSGAIAGVYAATDAARGVWKAPAGVHAGLEGIDGPVDGTISDEITGELNALGINCLRTFPGYGTVEWGSRTLAGSDLAGSPFKYVPVRRLADFIELSLQQSLAWTVFEPNGPELWSSISREVTAFMAGLFAEGAFAGTSAAAAYTVACDATTTSPTDLIEGVVNVRVGFAPEDPAEFVMLNIQINAAPRDANEERSRPSRVDTPGERP